MRSPGFAAAARGLAAAVLLAVGPLRLGRPARAFGDGQPPARVRLIVAAGAPEAARVEAVVNELLHRLSIVTESTRVERIDLGELAAGATDGDPYLARAWVDLRRPDVAILYLVDARRERLVVREIERPAGGDELVREQLGHILETSCEGLLAGETIGVPRAEVMPLLGVAAAAGPPPATVARTSAAVQASGAGPVPAGWTWAVGAQWAVGLLSSQAALTHGPAVSASVFAPRRGNLAWGATVWAQLRFPVEASTATAAGSEGVRVTGWTLRALAIAQRRLSRAAVARLGIGGGADLLAVEPRATPDVALLAESRALRIGVLTALAGVERRLVRDLCLTVSATVDLDLSGTDLVFVAASGDRVVLHPWPVRPGMLAGVTW